MYLVQQISMAIQSLDQDVFLSLYALIRPQGGNVRFLLILRPVTDAQSFQLPQTYYVRIQFGELSWSDILTQCISINNNPYIRCVHCYTSSTYINIKYLHTLQ